MNTYETSSVLAQQYGHHGWGGGPWFLLIPFTFWVIVIVIAVLARRRWGRRWAGRSGEATLGEVFARGEITEEEYRHRLTVLRETPR